jgi:hypothetical protein
MEFNYENFQKLLNLVNSLEKEVTRQKLAHIKTLSLLDVDKSPKLSIEAVRKLELSNDYIVMQIKGINLVRSLN